MKYLMFICANGLPTPEALAVLQRECPGWVEEMEGRGVRLLGRELDLPETRRSCRSAQPGGRTWWHAGSTSWGTRCRARRRPRRSASAAGKRCSATGRSPAPRSSPPASTSSAALIGSRRSSSRPRIRSPGTTRLRYARSTANDHAHRAHEPPDVPEPRIWSATRSPEWLSLPRPNGRSAAGRARWHDMDIVPDKPI